MKADGPELSFSDSSAENTFVSFFASLQKKTSDDSAALLRLFERNNGEYYSVHGDNALFVSEQFYKTSTVLKYIGSRKLPTCTLSKANATLFMNTVLTNGFRLEIWTSEGRGNWVKDKVASPGNWTQVEDMLFSSSKTESAPVILALKVANKGDQTVVGISYTDASSYCKIGVAEFIDNDIFSNLESILVQLSVKECIIPEDTQNYELKKLKCLLNRCEVVYTEVSKSYFKLESFEQDMDRLLASETSITTYAEFDLTTAMSCTACLVKYLALTSDEANVGEYVLETHDLTNFMRLDASALKALNLMPGPQDGSNKTMSIFGLLNHCKTSQGSRLLAQFIKQPLMSLEEIEKRQNIVETFYTETLLRQDVQECLKAFPDLHRLGKRFQREKATLQDVIRVYQVVGAIPTLQSSLFEYEGDKKEIIHSVYVAPLTEFYEKLSRLSDLVESTVDLEAADHHEYIVKPQFSPELNELRNKMNDIQEEIERLARKAARDLNVDFEKKLKYEQNSQYGHFLRLTRADAGRIRGKKEYIELSTQKSGVLFTTPMIRELCDSYQELSESYNKIQRDVAKEVISITASYFPVLEQLNQVIAHLDVLTSFAHASSSVPIPYVRPRLHSMGDADLVLKAARHPCVELQDNVSFIENDVAFVKGESVFHIVSGPNMGGKSTFIRQVGVIVLLAQIGCFVPCREADIPIVDSILARVGAGDSQLKGISTFMAEMLETTSILKTATPNSLVIVDELGRGTSTSDGFGLAWAISEFIASRIGCFCFFATHFHELASLEHQIPTVKNFHVKAVAEGQTMTLLYKVVPGPCDRSFGIHVAEMAQFPASVVKLARQKAAQLEEFQSQQDDVQMQEEGAEDLLKTSVASFGEKLQVESMTQEQIENLLVCWGDTYQLLDNSVAQSLVKTYL